MDIYEKTKQVRNPRAMVNIGGALLEHRYGAQGMSWLWKLPNSLYTSCLYRVPFVTHRVWPYDSTATIPQDRRGENL